MKSVIYKVGNTEEEIKKFKYTIRNLYSEFPNLHEILEVDKSNFYKMLNGNYFGNPIVIKKILDLVPQKEPKDIGLVEILLKEQKIIFSNRLNELLTELGFIALELKNKWFENNFDIASSTYSKWLNAKTIPDDENLYLLAKKLKVSVYYLKGYSDFKDIDNEVINVKTGLDEDDIKDINKIKGQSIPRNTLFDLPKSLYDITPLDIMKYFNASDFYNLFAQKIKERYREQLELQRYLKMQNVDIDKTKIRFEKNINKLKSELNCAINDIYDELFFEKNNNDL